MKRFAFICGSRADTCPLTPVIEAFGKHAIRIKTQGMYGHETALLSALKYHNAPVVLLGDRFETLIAASCAALLGLPIIHLHGGDYTPNCVDEGFRNAISKLAYFHFPACQLHADRLVAMGENPEHIFVCGAPGVDNLMKPTDEILLEHPMALVCYHPETLGDSDMGWTDHLDGYRSIVISGANADAGGDKINAFWQEWIKQRPQAIFQKTFTSRQWLSFMKHADVVIGNSSGFVFEAMTLGKKFINVGNRQNGRYEDALSLFKKDWQDIYPFGKPGEVSKKIAEKILSLEIPVRPVKYARTRN
jgi:UDP-hydrolysing UDP-N-acetyl-D-glucosamine 2-epimerase